MNKVILLGRLVKDPELKHTNNGNSVASFTVAVNRRFAKQGEDRKADFINCVAWRTTAEFISKYFTKGSMLSVCGNIQTRTYDDKDGKKIYVTEVIVDEVYFAGDRQNSSSTNTYNEGLPAMDMGVFNSVTEFDNDDRLPF